MKCSSGPGPLVYSQAEVKTASAPFVDQRNGATQTCRLQGLRVCIEPSDTGGHQVAHLTH